MVGLFTAPKVVRNNFQAKGYTIKAGKYPMSGNVKTVLLLHPTYGVCFLQASLL